jgi:hypothetical protein
MNHNIKYNLRDSIQFIQALIDLEILEDFGDAIERDISFDHSSELNRRGATIFCIECKDVRYKLKHSKVINKWGKTVDKYELLETIEEW